MKRRGFLKMIGIAGIWPFRVPGAFKTSSVRKVYLDEVYIAGFQYHDGMQPAVANALGVGDELDLWREPENPYDERAIAVLTRSGQRLGYVPKRRNGALSRIADQDVLIGAEVSCIDLQARTWERVRIKVYQQVEGPPAPRRAIHFRWPSRQQPPSRAA